jgi:hypothetical protein
MVKAMCEEEEESERNGCLTKRHKCICCCATNVKDGKSCSGYAEKQLMINWNTEKLCKVLTCPRSCQFHHQEHLPHAPTVTSQDLLQQDYMAVDQDNVIKNESFISEQLCRVRVRVRQQTVKSEVERLPPCTLPADSTEVYKICKNSSLMFIPKLRRRTNLPSNAVEI